MTQEDITELRNHIGKDNQFIVISKSQYVITNTPASPCIFDDTKQHCVHFQLSQRSYNSKNGKKVEVIILPYEEIENITLIDTRENAISFAQEYGITGDELQRIKDAFETNHGTYIETNQNVIV